jgi:2-polyprenyl-3-methyl-5-hydroxy-6-metoxy-1,4-benzoquinol methylase
MDKVFHNGIYYTKDEIKNVVEEYYSSVYLKKRDRHVQMQKLFPNDLTKESKILDYGCGMGGISQLFNEKYNCDVDGVDISVNELEKAKIAFGYNDKLNFLLLEEFSFPEKYYDLIFSSQVIEHVHNPGNYLSKINNMMKDNGYLLIGLPNIVNLNYLSNLMFFTSKRAKKLSNSMLNDYNKANDHINGWDPYHFIILLASCGFELIEYLPTEGTPLSIQLRKIPIIGKYIYNLPFKSRLSYTMFFLAKKVKDVNIKDYD